MSSILPVLCLVCAATITGGAPPQPPLADATGEVSFRHERIGGRHLLRLSTGGRIVDSDAERLQRMVAFADAYAAHYCNAPYRLTEARRRSWPDVRPIQATNILFTCLPDRPARTVLTSRY